MHLVPNRHQYIQVKEGIYNIEDFKPKPKKENKIYLEETNMIYAIFWKVQGSIHNIIL